MSNTTANSSMLTRSEVWAKELKDVLMDDLEAQNWVRWLSDFPDGDTFTIPSIGEHAVRDYVEDSDITYDAIDKGEFQFQITEYLSAATYLTRKQAQDGYYMPEFEASFVPKQRRAIMERLETDILSLGNQQTASDTNAINGAAHRFVGSGGADGARQLAPADFARAKFGLKKAKVPLMNLVAIVDPAVAFHLETSTNLVNVSNNPQWEGIIESGLTTGMRFIRNVYGFDVYESNYLPTSGVASETIETRAVSAANGVANLFFAAVGGDIMPFVGAWRQMPEIDSEFNKDRQRDEYVTTARYGVKLFRPENLIVALSDDNTVS